MEVGLVPTVSVLISTKDRCVSLKNVLAQLARQTYPCEAFEVLVVDGGTDETRVEMHKLAPSLPYRLVFEHAPGLSISAARNRALRNAEGDYLIIIDDDVFPPTTFIEAYVEAHRACPQSLLQGELLPASGTALLDKVRLLDLTQHRRDDATGINHCNAHTFNLSVSRRAAMAEPFDEAIDCYGWEDVEWGYRLVTRQKLTLRYLKEAVAFHHKPQQTAGGVARENFQGSKGMLHFLSKHPDVIQHEDACLLKRHAAWLIDEIHRFSPYSPAQLARKKDLLSLYETEARLTGLGKAWEQLVRAYHELEVYAAREGSLCRLYDLPIRESAFSVESHELPSCLIRWPAAIRRHGGNSPWLEELAEPYLGGFSFFCGGPGEKALSLELFPHESAGRIRTPFSAALCLTSLWDIPPPFLPAYSEIWVPTRFDQDAMAALGFANVSVLPWGRDPSLYAHALLDSGWELPGSTLYFVDAGPDPGSRGLPALIRAFQHAFLHSDQAALIVAFPEGSERAVYSILQPHLAPDPKRAPLILIRPYRTPGDRQGLVAAADVVVYAGEGESIVPYLFEGTAMGKAIVATPAGGHADFLGETSAFIIPCEILTSSWRPKTAVHAEALSQTLKSVHENRGRRHEKGKNAKADAYRRWNAKTMVRAAFERLSQLIARLSPEQRSAFFLQQIPP